MATIKRRSDRAGRWQVRYRDDKGTQRARLFERKVDAERSRPPPRRTSPGVPT